MASIIARASLSTFSALYTVPQPVSLKTIQCPVAFTSLSTFGNAQQFPSAPQAVFQCSLSGQKNDPAFLILEGTKTRRVQETTRAKETVRHGPRPRLRLNHYLQAGQGFLFCDSATCQLQPSLPPEAPGQQVALLKGHPEEVYHCEFVTAAATGRVLLLVASSESLFVWDVESQQLLHKADAPGTAGSSLSPEEAMKQGYTGAYIFGCAMQPALNGGNPSNGRLIATACADSQLRVWSLGSDGRLSFLHAVALTAGARILTSCAFDPHGKWLACTARDGTVFVLDALTLSVVRTLRVPDVTYSCGFAHREGRAWLVLPGSQGQLTMIDIENPGSIPTTVQSGFGFESPLLVVSEARGGTLIAAAGEVHAMAPIRQQQPQLLEAAEAAAAAPQPCLASKGPDPSPGTLEDRGYSASATTSSAAAATVTVRRKGRDRPGGAGSAKAGLSGFGKALDSSLDAYGELPAAGAAAGGEESSIVASLMATGAAGPAQPRVGGGGGSCHLDVAPEGPGLVNRAPIFLWRIS